MCSHLVSNSISCRGCTQKYFARRNKGAACTMSTQPSVAALLLISAGDLRTWVGDMALDLQGPQLGTTSFLLCVVPTALPLPQAFLFLSFLMENLCFLCVPTLCLSQKKIIKKPRKSEVFIPALPLSCFGLTLCLSFPLCKMGIFLLGPSLCWRLSDPASPGPQGATCLGKVPAIVYV